MRKAEPISRCPMMAPSVKGSVAIAQPAARIATACAGSAGPAAADAPGLQHVHERGDRQQRDEAAGGDAADGARSSLGVMRSSVRRYDGSQAWLSDSAQEAPKASSRHAIPSRASRPSGRASPFGTRPPGDVAALVHLATRKPPPPQTADPPTADPHRGSTAETRPATTAKTGPSPKGAAHPLPCKAGPVSPPGGRNDAGPTGQPLKAKILR